MKAKIIRTATVPISLNILLRGQLNYLNQYFEIVAMSGNGSELNEVKEREGVIVQSLEMQRNISPIKDFVALIKLYFYFKKEKPIIVHSITPKAGLLSMVAARLAGVPIRIHTFTGLIFPSRNGIMQKILIQMDRLLCNCATNIIPEGQGVKRDLENYKITNKPLKIIANGNVNGIDTNYFSLTSLSVESVNKLKEDLQITGVDLVFVFVGRLVGDKGINELVTAFENICQSKYNCKLVLVGPSESEIDPLNAASISIIKKNKNIISEGFQQDVRPYLAIADVLVFPSYREGFPNVVMQAGAMGLPAIVTNINGCNEIIEEGKNGTIIPPKDEQELEKAMLKMIDNPEYRLSLQQNARHMICCRYEQQVVWDALLNEYQTLIQNLPNQPH